MDKPYKVRITAGCISKWLGPSLEAPFVDDEKEATVFKDYMPDFYRYVLREVQYDDFHDGKTYDAIGLERIEFVFVS